MNSSEKIIVLKLTSQNLNHWGLKYEIKHVWCSSFNWLTEYITTQPSLCNICNNQEQSFVIVKLPT